MTDLSLLTFNCHGFSQVQRLLLAEVCAEQLFIDFIFVQELWMTPANWNTIEFIGQLCMFWFICNAQSDSQKV